MIEVDTERNYYTILRIGVGGHGRWIAWGLFTTRNKAERALHREWQQGNLDANIVNFRIVLARITGIDPR